MKKDTGSFGKIPEMNFPDNIKDLRSVTEEHLERGRISRAYYHALMLYVKSIYLQDYTHILFSLDYLSRILLDLEFFSDASHFLEQGLELAEKKHDFDNHIRFNLYKAELLIRTGQAEEADDYLGFAESELSGWYNKKLYVELYILKSYQNHTLRYGSTALEFAQKALEEFSDVEGLPLVKIHEHMAFALSLNKQSKQAIDYFNTALGHCEVLGHTFYLGKLYYEIGMFLGNELGTFDPKIEIDPRRPPAYYFSKAVYFIHKEGSVKQLMKIYQAFKQYGRRYSDNFFHPVITEEENRIFHFYIKIFREKQKYIRTTLDSYRETVKSMDDRMFEFIEEHFKHVFEQAFSQHQHFVSMLISHGKVMNFANQLGVERQRLFEITNISRKLSFFKTERDFIRRLLEIVQTTIQADGIAFYPFPSNYLNTTSPLEYGKLKPGWYQKLDWFSGFKGYIEDFKNKISVEYDMKEGDISQFLVIPMISEDKIYGLIYAERYHSNGYFSFIDYKVLETLVFYGLLLLQNFKNQQSIRLAYENLKSAFNSVQEGVITLDNDWNIIDLNHSAAKMLGIPYKKAQGRNLTSIIKVWNKYKDFKIQNLNGKILKLPKTEVILHASVFSPDFQTNTKGVVISLFEINKVYDSYKKIKTPKVKYTFDLIIGKSEKIKSQKEMAKIAAKSDSTVLITGESGTGKEVFAQAIHAASKRAAGPFVGINCAAIPAELMESELFGYEAGAFTGAKQGGQAGKFEFAQGGTLLLDEIGDMPYNMQAKLLRVLQERRFRRVGGNLEYIFDLRIIATTNKDLEQLVKEGKFREDLFYRLKVIHLKLPPLRERITDIPLFANRFTAKYSELLNKNVRAVSPDLMKRLIAYPWYGNIREMEHLFETEINICPDDEEILAELRTGLIKPVLQPAETAKNPFSAQTAPSTMEDAEKQMLTAALVEARGSVTKAARILKLSRGSIYNKIKKFGLDLNKFKVLR